MTYGPLNRRVTGPFNLALHTTLANKYKYSGRMRFFFGQVCKVVIYNYFMLALIPCQI